MRQKIVILLLSLFIGSALSATGQVVGVKTNILYDATSTVNLGLEFGLSPRWTLDVSGNYNAWSKNSQTKWKHAMLQPEARYWFCDRFSRHFLGMHLVGGAFNFGGIRNNISYFGADLSVLTDHRYQGYSVGAGLGYGFAFVLSEHINLELEAGLGYMYLMYDTYECTGCGQMTGSDASHYIGPTKLAFNLVFLF